LRLLASGGLTLLGFFFVVMSAVASLPANRPDGERIFPGQLNYFRLMADHEARRITAVRLTLINAAGLSGKTGTFRIDEIYVGLNDLSLGYGMKFMFQLLADGTVERLCNAFRDKGIPYGFGGIAAIGQGLLPAERVIAEHYRLGSECVILSRSFCNAAGKSIEEIRSVFEPGVAAIRDRETECRAMTAEGFEENRLAVVDAVDKICAIIAAKKA
jgi:hypothetical protein